MKKRVKNKQDIQKIINSNKAITLIALVVTIVVLLILAGVSINILAGDNGIIKQAIESKDKTKEANAKEQIGVEVTGSYGTDGKISIDLLNKNLRNIEGIKYNGAELSDSNKITTLPVTVELDGVKVIINVDGSTKPILPAEKGKTYETETKVIIGNQEVTIPGEATISGIEGEYENADDGIVIYIMKDADGDGNIDTPNWNDPEMMKTTYDQLVWVPVPNAVLDLSGNSEALSTEASIKVAVQEEIKKGRYPMAIKKDATNYFGVLYQFSLDNETNKVKVEPHISWTPLSTTFREPAYLENPSYADGSSYNTVGITASSLQSEFNTMVGKVASNKGFWVGRYETSSMVLDNTQDSTNKIGVIKGTTTGINNVNWYRMYAQQKNYSKLALGSTTTAISSMIWGSQWDQIMIWMKEIKNENKNSYYVINSLTMGNFGTSDDADTSTTEPAPTGNSEDYKVKNIYDLAGNVYDWSLEAVSTYYRVKRRRLLQQYGQL